MEERWQEEQNQWSLSPFDSELVWAAHPEKDWWLKEHSGLCRKKQKRHNLPITQVVFIISQLTFRLLNVSVSESLQLEADRTM